MKASRHEWPTRIRVGAEVIRVEYRAPTRDERDSSTDGWFDSGRMVIWVSTKSTPVRMLHVLLHELLHFAWFRAGGATSMREEPAVGAMACGLLDILAANPKLREVIARMPRLNAPNPTA